MAKYKQILKERKEAMARKRKVIIKTPVEKVYLEGIDKIPKKVYT